MSTSTEKTAQLMPLLKVIGSFTKELCWRLQTGFMDGQHENGVMILVVMLEHAMQGV